MILKIGSISVLLGVSLAQEQASYGPDCSFPIFSKDFKCGDLLGDRKAVYDGFMEGCRTFYGKKGGRCDSTENDRIAMDIYQPQSIVNHTSTGFKKMKAPKEVWKLLSEHWEKNKDDKMPERWPAGNIYVNHWAAPTYMVSVEDQSLRGGGYHLKSKIWDAVRPTIEEWTGMEQTATSQYGIRVYTDGAILNPHADRLPLVSSCIINVAQDVDEPWPLEVYDRNNRAVNVTMEPGDMVLYESGSLIHGRPFPLKGRYFANIFIHFEPTGRPLGDKTGGYLDTLDNFLPPYVLENSPGAEEWTKRNPGGWAKPSPSAPVQQFNAPEGHNAAAHGDVTRLEAARKKDHRLLHIADKNGWAPIHEAARGGHADALDYLIKNGADIDARTGRNGRGSSPLNLALTFHGEDHDAVQFLRKEGARNIAEGEL